MAQEIPAPEPAPARRTDRALPSRRHLPGAPPPQDFAPVADFDYGCDLFDHRYYWEAHEVWECEWRLLPVGSPERDFLQGLICASAFMVKQHQGVTEGAARLLERACGWLGRVGPVMRGIDVPELVARLHRFREGGPWVSLPRA